MTRIDNKNRRRIKVSEFSKEQTHKLLRESIRELYLLGEKARKGKIRWAEYIVMSASLENKIREYKNILKI